MVENGTKLKVNIFVLTVHQEKKEHVQVGQLFSRLLYTMLQPPKPRIIFIIV